MQQEFCRQYRPGRIKTANAYAFDRNFKPTLRSAMHFHNMNHTSIASEERVQSLRVQVNRMKEVMGMHIQLLLERGDDLSRLSRKSDAMQEDVSIFRRNASRNRRRQARRMYLTVAAGAFIVIVLLILLSLGICGVGYRYCRHTESSRL